ncbi:MAG: Na(+)-translocating NADH-quinone reductase subunit A [Paludibacteraceae bacterium]|nr:Na(+)-translocating NADH-quinone reductase subunit A [Paludibacteraceae bacterium]
MNNVIKLTKGLDLPLEGVAAQDIKSVARPAVFSVVPDHYAGIKPKMLVKEGAVVKAGSPLFCDKTFDQMQFVSPVSGTVKAVVRGDKRKVMQIDIEADQQNDYLHFDTSVKTADDVKALLLQSGLWVLMHQRPYDCIAMPSKQPKAIFISAFDSAPVAPDYNFVVKGHASELQAAVSALAKLAPVFVGVRNGASATEFLNLKDCTIVPFEGKHPAGNVGVQLNHVAPLAKGETVFTVGAQDLLLIGRFFTKGIVDMSRLVALTGPLAATLAYFNVLPGMPLESILRGNITSGVSTRIVAGNVLSGHKAEQNEYVEPQLNQLTIIAEGTEARDFMGWIMPRFNNHSNNLSVCGTILAKLGKKHFDFDARLLGGRRAIIVSGEYDKVFPMDIYPEYLIKAMIAGNIDRMEALGAYEVAPEDFALCEYVCTSKMPLQAIVRQALDNLKAELE